MNYSYLYGAEGKPLAYSQVPYKKNKLRIFVAAFLCMVLVVGVVGSQFTQRQDSTALAQSDENNLVVDEQPTNDFEPKQTWSTETDLFKNPKKQPIDLSAWLASHKGTYGISVYEEGDKLVDHRSIEPFSMESIYKLYVAYIGYQKIDQGKWNESEIYLNDWTRGKCLDQMIRTSHSPCGEKIMDEIGKANIQDILNSYGLENTSFTQLTTSSDDVANILIRLQKNLDLSPDSTKKLLDSMNGQIHRDALPKGFGDYWKVYDKVGFRDFNEYHDVAIVVTPRGKTYIVSVLSSGAGTANIADLAETLKKSMTE